MQQPGLQCVQARPFAPRAQLPPFWVEHAAAEGTVCGRVDRCSVAASPFVHLPHAAGLMPGYASRAHGDMAPTAMRGVQTGPKPSHNSLTPVAPIPR